MIFKRKSFILLFGLLVFILTACAKPAFIEDDVDRPPLDTGMNETKDDIDEEEKEEEEDKDPRELIDLSLQPNELGDIMVLMYHNVGEEEEEWVRRPENLRKDLQTLYDKGYRAVSLKDYANNTMDVEAGMTPVVITFDDGNENNFRLIEDENNQPIIDPESAIGILESFKEDYPDFNLTATFFVFGDNPFRQKEHIDYKFNYLIDNGYDIGNHTYDHRSMKKADGKDYIQEGIGKQIKVINDILPNYSVNTYALAYGERPKDEGLEEYLAKGSYEDINYENIAIVNVGWNPAPSPLVEKFNPLSLPRIRASEMKVDNVGLYNWLEYFDNNPKKRYISDGLREVITIPKDLEELLNKEKIEEENLYIYERD